MLRNDQRDPAMTGADPTAPADGEAGPAAAPTLSSLVASRICHDLISPIGAIANGLELLAMTGSTGPETELIEQSCRMAASRVRLFRIAFGRADAGEGIGPDEAQDILAAVTEGGRIEAHWRIGEPLARTEAQLAFLAALCLETALPRGGQIVLERRNGRLVATATGPLFNVEGAHWRALRSGQMPLLDAPGQIQFPLLASLSRAHGRSPEVRHTEEMLQIEV